jgi:peptidoglycan hydrolase CwlO-like protein
MKSFRLLLVLVLAVVIAMAFMSGCEKAAGVKDAFITTTSATLDDYKAKVDDLAKKAEALPSPAKDTAMEKIDAVKAKMDEANAKLEELKGASSDKWTLLMSDVSALVAQIGTLYGEAVTAVAK